MAAALPVLAAVAPHLPQRRSKRAPSWGSMLLHSWSMWAAAPAGCLGGTATLRRSEQATLRRAASLGAAQLDTAQTVHGTMQTPTPSGSPWPVHSIQGVSVQPAASPTHACMLLLPLRNLPAQLHDQRVMQAWRTRALSQHMRRA